MDSAMSKQVLILNANYVPLSYYPLSVNSMKKVLKSYEEGAEDFLKPSNRETPKNLGMPILEMFTTL